MHWLLHLFIKKYAIQRIQLHWAHTLFQNLYGSADVLMLMVADNMKIGLVTEHVPVAELGRHISKEKVISKLLLNQSP
jgi:4-hydroxythreonine-4-phosphate dehydrogenase